MATIAKETGKIKRRGIQLDLRLWWARSWRWLDSEIGQDFLRVGLCRLDQRSPFCLLYLLRVAYFRPVNSLLAISDQSNSAFNSNLHIFLAHLQPKIFRRIKALGKSKESRGFLFLREELGEESRQPCFSLINALACFCSMKLKERNGVKKRIIVRIFKFEFLRCFTCHDQNLLIKKQVKERKSKGCEVVQILTDKATVLRP